MTRLLAIDTATEACSAALYIDGDVYERYDIAPRRHAELILGMSEAVLAEGQVRLGDLEALAFGRGPGAFTGLRIATGVIQGMAYARDLPVVPVSSLAALAQGAWRTAGHTHIMAAIDARMSEVYWGCYQCDGHSAVLLGEEQVCAPTEVRLPNGNAWFGTGSGWDSYAQVLRQRSNSQCSGFSPQTFPRARDIAMLAAHAFSNGHAVTADQALPIYLRDNVAKKKSEQSR